LTAIRILPANYTRYYIRGIADDFAGFRSAGESSPENRAGWSIHNAQKASPESQSGIGRSGCCSSPILCTVQTDRAGAV